MTKISKNTFQFLIDLKENNNREWFTANKKRYETAKTEFELFLDQLIVEISRFDESINHVSAKDCVFRIYRDVRFSKDKSPYKVHLGAYITSAKKKTEIHDKAGYYIQLAPGDSMIAGGAYLPQGAWLQAIRQEINYNSEEFIRLLTDGQFSKYFGAIQGEKLARPPKGYAADHPDIELLKHKSFLAMHTCTDKQVLADGFIVHSVAVCKAMAPFNRFLNRSLE